MLTDVGDLIFDPFAGSCVTGEVCERLSRQWICCEIVEEYIEGAKGRFASDQNDNEAVNDPGYYKIYSPASLWENDAAYTETLPEDGGKKRPPKRENSTAQTTKSQREKNFQMKLKMVSACLRLITERLIVHLSI
jgi:site-specific DNA-methyltransferase (cytosine-N4-specific)